MKKVISLVLVFILMLSVAVMPAFAENELSGEFLFEDRFVENVTLRGFSGGRYNYAELYYHHIDEADIESEIDWVFVLANDCVAIPWCIKQVVDDRVFLGYNEYFPFLFGYSVYDVKEDIFYALERVDVDKYNGLDEYLYENRIGVVIGDADGDYKLSILDASFIQLAIAEFCEFSKDDYIGGWTTYGEELDYISDIDRDGERTVLDATAIQYKLAGLEFIPDTNE